MRLKFKIIFYYTDMDLIYISRSCYTNYLKRNHVWKMGIATRSYSTTPFQNPVLNKHLESVQNKVYDVMKWYEQLTGLDEVRTAQNKVIEAQERFAAAQEKRREVTLELNDVKNKIKDLQEELSTTSRGEERYIALITKEHKLLKEEIRLTDKFNLYEREERELFTTLTSSVKDSHERERIQANKTKYLSIIGSVLGALIGITGSAINNHSKITQLKKMVSQSTQDSKRELSAICAQLELAVERMKSPSVNTDAIKKQLHDVSKTLEQDVQETQILQQSLTRIEKNLGLLMQKESVKPVHPADETEDGKQWDLFSVDVKYPLMYCIGAFILFKLFSS